MGGSRTEIPKDCTQTKDNISLKQYKCICTFDTKHKIIIISLSNYLVDIYYLQPN